MTFIEQEVNLISEFEHPKGHKESPYNIHMKALNIIKYRNSNSLFIHENSQEPLNLGRRAPLSSMKYVY